MMDFTLIKYNRLLAELQTQNFAFQTFAEFLKSPKERSILLRHDVDLMPENSLTFARIQAQNDIYGVYYFRAVPESWNEKIIKEIHSLGHEVGYHYECLTTSQGDMEQGIKDFQKNLENLRKLVPVSTICMHGSPMSKFDSKNLWKKFDYRTFGIIGEPYFDINFNEVFYLTDTGRRWNGSNVSVRDKVNSTFDLRFSKTDDIIKACQNAQLPNKIMFTFHPQRWHNSFIPWCKELIVQNLKNQVKLLMVKSSMK